MSNSLQKVEPQTQVGRFLARRGSLITKEFRNFTKVKCQYGTSLLVSSLVLSTEQGTNSEVSYGVKFEHEDRDNLTESCLVDFDEIIELLHAMKHIVDKAKQLDGKKTGYTEVEYRTRDGLKIGFYQTHKGEQQAFFDVSPGGSMMFIDFDQLPVIFKAVKSALEYLIKAGASA